ncbi:hypothetical protein [Blastopirellula marina]|uniref:Uncharacterized protein n=1 Tax=Blastopirellula marina TaxID=124 RepID=A0A2S8GDZ2_9BACT|nr:hypothetical protein [Blastopirellula marina]PQO42643.1 hypothetical protein C5Y98_02050 [Blastopirellula marina]PTL46409.1 hypothetical protein C5Y97_02050 [Blastopirellula marina]
MQVTETIGFEYPQEALDIANSIVGVVDALIPGKTPFGERPLKLVLVDWSSHGPLVFWDEHAYNAKTYEIWLRSSQPRWREFVGHLWQKLFRHGYVDPNRPIYSWRGLAFQLTHEVAHLKMGPARSNLVLEVLATAVSLETFSGLKKAWQESPPTSWNGWSRYAERLPRYREAIVRLGTKDLPASIRQGFWQLPIEDQELSLEKTKREIENSSLLGAKSRAWQMAAAEVLVRRALSRKERWRDLRGIAMRTDPKASDEPGYRDDLPLPADAFPWWMPEWLR